VSGSTTRERLQLAVVVLSALALLTYIAVSIDPNEASAAIANVHWGLVATAGLTLLAVHAVRSLRFSLLVGGDESYGRIFAICAIGFLAVHVIPLRLGELVRPYLLHRDGVPLGRGLAAVFLERLFDLLGLLGLLVWIAVAVDLPQGGITVAGVDIVTTGQRTLGIAIVAGSIAIIALVASRRALVPLLIRTPWIGPPAVRLLTSFGDAAVELARRPGNAAFVLLCTAASWFLTVITIWITLLAFPGMPTSVHAAGVVWAATITGVIILPTPGSFGSWEVFCLAALMIYDVETDLGSTFAIFMHLVQFGFTAALGVPYLLWEGVSLGALVRESRRAMR
jgi:hypothetical protein